MTATTIISEGLIYLDGRHIWSKDRFRVFDRAASIGSELDEGRRADKNYVWLSRWQLENINKNHLLPIKLESYLRLKNHIAKALVPHLQIWMYASRNAFIFKKRYDELCQVLNLHPYSHTSKIKEKLGPSLDELVEHGYLAEWSLDLTSDQAGHKIIFQHGWRFESKDKKAGNFLSTMRVHQSLKSPGKEKQKLNPLLLEELVRRDIPEIQAKRLLANIFEGQEVMDQLEWGDYLIRQNSGSKILNPPGFYIYLIRENIRPPEFFETSRKKAISIKQKQAREQEIDEQAALELAYEDYREQILESYIAENYSGEKYQALIERKKEELSPQYRQFAFWKPDALMKFLEASVRADLEKDLFIRTSTHSEQLFPEAL